AAASGPRPGGGGAGPPPPVPLNGWTGRFTHVHVALWKMQYWTSALVPPGSVGSVRITRTAPNVAPWTHDGIERLIGAFAVWLIVSRIGTAEMLVKLSGAVPASPSASRPPGGIGTGMSRGVGVGGVLSVAVAVSAVTSV